MTSTATAAFRALAVLLFASLTGHAVADEPTASKPTADKATTVEEPADDSSGDFVGIWSSHYRTTFVYLIIHSDRTANFILLDQGHQFAETEWVPAKNGIIVKGLPMFRLWKGDSPNTARAQMQAFPQEMTNDTFGRFPLHFHMKRQDRSERTADIFGNLPIPQSWMNGEPPARFNELAGVPRPKPQ